MKRLRGPAFDSNRIPIPPAMLKASGLTEEDKMGDDYNGCFVYTSPTHMPNQLRIITGRGRGWDHISVSLADRCPTWAEMDWVKRLFFEDDEVAFQLHVTPKDHINYHPYTLHIWRPLRQAIPLPPSIMV